MFNGTVKIYKNRGTFHLMNKIKQPKDDENKIKANSALQILGNSTLAWNTNLCLMSCSDVTSVQLYFSDTKYVGNRNNWSFHCTLLLRDTHMSTLDMTHSPAAHER
ncbi:hypothetical protein GOODEAATRI_014595 [Goodea atripinnis]|uniref:Uncharacterized protein n=1 Tax=Goodea atripinnis TaxID=208336 RepID=A0ABV0NAN4_9TELE